MSLALKPFQLRRTYNVSQAEFRNSAEIAPRTTIIGQPRGVQAIEFGINMDSPGYNIYVLGESGTGRTTAIQRFVEERAASDPIPPDWVYVHNFQTPHKPIALQLPAGSASKFRTQLTKLISRLRGDIARAFDNQQFRNAALEVGHVMENRRAMLFTTLQQKANKIGAAILPSAEGFQIVPAVDGQPLQREQLATLSEEQLTAWKETFHVLQHELNETLHQARKLEHEAQNQLDELIQRVARSVVDVAIAEIKEPFAGQDEVQAYLDSVHQDIIENVDVFRVPVEEEKGDAMPDDDMPPTEWFRRYQVNVVVDHRDKGTAPVVIEYDPTIPHLLGRIEHEARQGGAVATDFTLLRAGALHAANGGYLILRARDLFSEFGAWDSLKRTLVGEAIRPDDPAIRGGAATRSLDPEPIPLDVKVILIGPPQLYYTLYQLDEDFRTLFKVMADFDAVVERTSDNEREYATFVATLCHDEELMPLDRASIGRVIEYGSRLAGTQNKLSTRFGLIADLVREANYWAKSNKHSQITLADVRTAIDTKTYMHNRIETRTRDFLREGKRLVSTEGAVVGQINALSVSQIGEHAFGQPSRVTARTYVGKTGVVQIDREVRLAGPLHNKGVMTLIGYLGGQYADDLPLSLAAQITFEQNYGGVDGDSASSTELYALLSSLSGVPIKQSLAVTGSVNQLGEVQVIGGVTEKVEGWYKVCKDRGLTGEQGVLIPAANVSDLMLHDEVVQAVEDGNFAVWAVSTIDEGIELLTGASAETVHTAVKARLQQLAETMANFEHRR